MASQDGAVSEETRQRVAAAKQYIEGLYQQRNTNLQERYARCDQGRLGAREGAAQSQSRPMHSSGWLPPPPLGRRRNALQQELKGEGLPPEEQAKIIGELEKRESDYMRLQVRPRRARPRRPQGTATVQPPGALRVSPLWASCWAWLAL
jgi:hypothetical protein